MLHGESINKIMYHSSLGVLQLTIGMYIIVVCCDNKVKLLLFFKHTILISIVDLCLGVTSMFEKLILLYHYSKHVATKVC